MSRRIVLFGAGDGGRRALSWLGLEDEVVAVVDNNAAKHGHFLLGHRITGPAIISELEFDVVLVGSMYFDEIRSCLRELNIPDERIEPAFADSVNGAGPMRDLDNFQPLVSVIMPAYNRATVVGRAVQSVLKQRYSRLELIVIDDGSTDKTREVAAEAAASDPRFRLLACEHRGVSAARNAGLRAARGELIAYLDSDNRWHEEYLFRMLTYFANGQYVVGYGASNVFDNERGLCYLRHSAFDRGRLAKRNFIDLNVFMHHRSLVETCGGFDETMTRLVDWDLVLRYTEKHTPFVLGAALVDYYIESDVARISTTESFETNYILMRQRTKPSELV